LPHLEAYVARLEAGSLPADRHEDLDAETERRESIDLSLRQADGLELVGDLALIPANFWIDLDRHGLGALRDGRVRLTTRGWLVSDSVVLQILALLDAALGSVDKPRRASVH
jgi:coproporphyrinogen III oxidase-like Fe-S oxidoreductase